MSDSNQVHALEVDAEQLRDLLKKLPPPLAEKMRKASISGVEAMIASFAAVAYDIEVSITPRWAKSPSCSMEEKCRNRHREQVADAEPLMVKGVAQFIQGMDMKALESYSDMLEELQKGGEA